MSRFRYLSAFAAGLLCLLLAAGCAAPVTTSPTPAAATPLPTTAPTASPVPTATAVPLPDPVGPESYPANVNPLTGLVVTDPSLLARRPLLIKISNAPEVVRPQSSTSHADWIIEHYAEGGWTRFSALFYGEDADHIGSVRSTRLVDLHLAPSFDAILVFSGGANGVIDMVRESGLYPYNAISPQFGYGEPYFVRFPREGLDFEHTLFTSTDILRDWLAEREVRQEPAFSTPGYLFDVMPPAGGQPASALQVDFFRNQVVWRYDPVSGAYLRWMDGLPHTDATNGEQLAFENVIVIRAFHEYVDLFPEKYFGSEMSWDIYLMEGGPAMLFRDGMVFEGRWERDEIGDLITFYGPDGEPLALKPGHSFIEITASAEGPYTRNGPEPITITP